MSEECADTLICIVVLCMLIVVFVLVGVSAEESGKTTGRRESERAAVDAGFAEYYLDANHNKQWRWKEAK